VDAPSKQELQNGTLRIKKSEQLSANPSTLDGLLQVNSHGFMISMPIVPGGGNSALFTMLLFAFLGGIILNLMPCVFPVLSMKVFSFLKLGGDKKKEIRSHAWAYTLGILVSFWLLVGILLIFKSGGEKIGWGFQLQSPFFVSALSAILFLFGLSLVGVFDFGGTFTGAGSSLAGKEGLAGAFFTGVLATLVSTPCTAPLMGTAVGFALSQSATVAFVIFTALALGLASPFLLLSYSPSLGKMLPRPGAWMETLKQITAFLIFATVIWLVSVVALQTSPSYLVIILGSFLCEGVAAWILHRWSSTTLGKIFAVVFILAGLILTATATPLRGLAETSAGQNTVMEDKNGLSWEDYSPPNLKAHLAKNEAVFLDFTAAWCLSCKVNELVVFSSEDVKKKLRDHHVTLMRADWTSHSEVITQALAGYGRSGVPTYVLYVGRADGKPLLLPEVITPGIITAALDTLK
jgi:thiol:disulfide interchange protein DsbD